MVEAPRILLEHHLKRLKLPTFLREYEKLARLRTPPDHEAGYNNLLSHCYITLQLSSGRSRHLLATSVKVVSANLYYEAMLVILVVLGFGPVWLLRAGLDAPWQRYLFPLLDSVLLAFILLVPNPFCDQCDLMPAPMPLRFHNAIFFIVLIAVAVFSYSPRIVFWTGVTAVLAWTVGTLWIIDQPGAFILEEALNLEEMTDAEMLAYVIDPNRVDIGRLVKVDVVFLIVAGVLAAAVHRTRKLAYRHAQAEHDRANIARHFSPNMVDEIAQNDQPMGAVRHEDIAVLFVDIVGFTRTSESQDPEQVITFLRAFHGRMAGQVFAHDGTLDKFLGDGLMATFGTPYPRPDDAERALACACDMAAEVVAWNREREDAGEPPVRIGIGLHFGPVVLGEIGDEWRLEFAVIGDTVNVASRLETMTRDLDVDVVASNDVVAQAQHGGVAGGRSGNVRQPRRGCAGSRAGPRRPHRDLDHARGVSAMSWRGGSAIGYARRRR